MSIWVNSKGKTYAGTGQNAWLKDYVDRVTDSFKQEVDANLSLHFAGTGYRHKAEDIDFDETTVKSALNAETEIRAKADAALETALAGETAARETANNSILAEVRSLNLKNGTGEGSLSGVDCFATTGDNAVQLGHNSQAAGANAFVTGLFNKAFSDNQLVRGRYNVSDENGVYAEIVGNGTSIFERSNAYTLDWEGNGHFAGDVYTGENKEKLAIANACLPGMTNYQGEINLGSFELYKEDTSLFQDDVDRILEKVESLTQDIDPSSAGMCVIRGDCTYYIIEDTLEDGNYLVASEGHSFPVYGWVYWRPDNGGDGSVHIRNSVILFQDILDGEVIFHYSRTGTYTEGDTWEQSGVWGDWEKDSYRGLVARKEFTGTVEDIKTDINGKQDKDTIVTKAENNTLVLAENQDARLGETSSLVLSMPESIGDWYRSTFSFQSGENATSLVYGYTPLDWKGDDVTSDGRFVPEPFSTYEVDVKNLGVNGIRARVDKIAGYSSVDVEGTVLTLPSSAGKALRDYKIYGNSVQNGEPTEETPVAIQSVGNYNGETGKYDVPIVVRGSNVFNKDGGNFIEEKGLEVIETGIRAYNYNTSVMYAADILKPNTTYYVHSDKIYSEEQKNATGRLTWNQGNGTVIMLGEGQTDNTFTTPDTIQGTITAYGFIGNTDYSKYVDFTNLYIGVVPYSEYQPYREPVTSTISLEEPLRKVGDVADYIDYKTALGSHLVTERALTGNESWTHVADGNYFKLALSREANTSAMESSLCSHYVYGDSALDQSFWIDGTEQALCIKDSRFTNEDEFKAWLQSVEVCVIYPTALATGELIKLPAIDTELYDNVITVDTEIQPSNVKVTYFKKG